MFTTTESESRRRKHRPGFTGFGLLVAFALLACASRQSDADEKSPHQLRVIAYNVYRVSGWPRDRQAAQQNVANGQIVKQMVEELARYQPDIINFSESPTEEVAEEIARQLGMTRIHFPSGLRWDGTLLTRLEVVDSQNVPLEGGRPEDLFTRHWGRCTLKLPDGELLVVHSAHLYPTASSVIRLREIDAMLQSMKADLDAGRSMLLIGDLNHPPTSKEYQRWQAAGWIDTFAKVGKGDGFTIKADTPQRRIDYVMAIGPIAERVVESRPLFEGAFRLDPNDPDGYALSDHLPQMATFNLAN